MNWKFQSTTNYTLYVVISLLYQNYQHSTYHFLLATTRRNVHIVFFVPISPIYLCATTCAYLDGTWRKMISRKFHMSRWKMKLKLIQLLHMTKNRIEKENKLNLPVFFLSVHSISMIFKQNWKLKPE